MEAPLGNIFVASGDSNIRCDNRIQAYFLNAIGSEINPRSVLCSICITRGVDEVTSFGAVVPLGA